ncbi:MAG: polysaccharide pyruvyl transferase family protein [Cyclobacterium sp.]|uniref:polysaccharide pyruvyl transferase family protein n=1 Tax=unclassified Cyclobacterium TaxID=2615055 RepID=UPI0013D2FA50|nr:polysaccharide pyruvyl transferase family protein [Cyclobacterium sp. SYSU L10401]
MKIRYAGFDYRGLNNLGDQVQSIAAERFLPEINMRLNRDTLASAHCNPNHLLIMNGWYSHQPEHCLPISNSILPVFWGFHISDWNDSWRHFLSEENLAFFKKHEPIGCRDSYTAEKLKAAGIEAFYSRCLTLTLPERKKKPEDGAIMIVDVPFLLPDFIEKNGLRMTHTINPDTTARKKRLQAKKLLYLYKRYATLVVTSRLHCALPCIAMGIPVIFFGNPLDYRVSIIGELGLNIYEIPKHSSGADSYKKALDGLFSTVDWRPEPLDFQATKKNMIHDFSDFLHKQHSKMTIY